MLVTPPRVRRDTCQSGRSRNGTRRLHWGDQYWSRDARASARHEHRLGTLFLSYTVERHASFVGPTAIRLPVCYVHTWAYPSPPIPVPCARVLACSQACVRAGHAIGAPHRTIRTMARSRASRTRTFSFGLAQAPSLHGDGMDGVWDR